MHLAKACCAILFVLSLSSARGEQVFNNSGLMVFDEGWDPNKYASDSYRAYHSIKNGDLTKFDYYYQLKLTPQMKLSFAGCTKLRSNDIIKNLIGVSGQKMLIVKLGIKYRFNQDSSIPIFKGKDVPVLYVGRNRDIGGGITQGCYFSITDETIFPLFRYEGGYYDEPKNDFMINISVNSGDNVKFNTVQRIVEGLNIFNAATSWTDLTGKRTEAFENAASKFEDAINGAGSQINSYNEEKNLKGIQQGEQAPSQFIFAAPSFVDLSAGTLMVYTRLISSVLIDAKTEATQELAPEDILSGTGLSSRACASEILEKGSCDLKIKTVREALLDYLKPPVASTSSRGLSGTPAETASPSQTASQTASTTESDSSDIFDFSSDRGQKKVTSVCKKIRMFASDKLRLATMDALLVRWSATNELAQVLQTDPELAASISKATNLSKDELAKICWNEDDKGKLNKFLSAMNYKPI